MKWIVWCSGVLTAYAVSGPNWFDVPQQDGLAYPNAQTPLDPAIQAQQLSLLQGENPAQQKPPQQKSIYPSHAKGDFPKYTPDLQDEIFRYNMGIAQQHNVVSKPKPDAKPKPQQELPPKYHKGIPAAYKFVRATGERAFTFLEATMACRAELDPDAELCSLKEIRAVAKQHSAMPSPDKKTDAASAGKGRSLITDWGWTGAPHIQSNTTGSYPTWYHIARLSNNGLEDGGPRWSSSANSLFERKTNGLSTPGWDAPHTVTYSNAHCCSHFKRFTAIGHIGDFTLNQARLKCSSEFSGHLCSTSELDQVFDSGIRISRDRWGWTNSPSYYGNETLNYHTANLWGGPLSAPLGTARAGAEAAKMYGGAMHDPSADFHSPARREWQVGNQYKTKPASRRLMSRFKNGEHATSGQHKKDAMFHTTSKHQGGRVLMGSQNSDTWKGAALCCKGITYMNKGIPHLKKWLLKQQVPNGNMRAGLFKSLDIHKDNGKSLPWPEAAFRSRVYDNAMASIALLLDMDQSSVTDQSFELKAVLRNLYALQSLLEDWSAPLGSKTIAFAFNLDGAPEPRWKSPVYTVSTASVVGQAFAHFALQTGSTAFNRDIQALAKWIVARQRPDGLLIRGFNGETPLESVNTEDNLEAWFFLRMCSGVLTDTLFDYSATAKKLEHAIIKKLWNPNLGSFDMWLGAGAMGKEKLKVLKMMSRGAIFLLSTERYTFARVMLDHPFWIQHTQKKHSDQLIPGQGWGAVVWAEGAATITEAYKRLGDMTAPYMLHDISTLVSKDDKGVKTVAQNVHQFFPYPSVSATAWYIIAQSPRSGDLWKKSYVYKS